jgi:hypothetical protein
MGSATSTLEKKDLYYQIKGILDQDSSGDEENVNDQVTYQTINDVYQKWYYKQFVNRHNIVRAPLIRLEETLDKCFRTGRTPIILDNSEDRKVLTFYSYQHTSIIDCTKLVTDHLVRKIPLKECLEYCRRLLVNAMKHGKLLIIDLGNSAPDFLSIFNDDNLRTVKKKAREQGVGERQPKTLEHEDIAYFPLDVLFEGGKQIREDTEVIKRLFREEDMAPHKNFAICRYRVNSYSVFCNLFPIEMNLKFVWLVDFLWKICMNIVLVDAISFYQR